MPRKAAFPGLSVYKRSGRPGYYVKYVDPNDSLGKRVKRQALKSLGYATIKEAHTYLLALSQRVMAAKEVKREASALSTSTTLDAWHALYMKDYERTHDEARQVKEVGRVLERFNDFLREFKLRFVGDIRREHLRAWWEGLDELDSASSKNVYMSYVRPYMIRAIHENMSLLQETDVTRTLRAFKRLQRLPEVLSTEELRSLISKLPEYDEYRACRVNGGRRSNAYCPLVFFMLLTGMRREEVERLEWRFVDLENGVIGVDKSKTNKPRKFSVSLSPLLQRMLEALKKRAEWQYVIQGTVKGKVRNHNNPRFKSAMIWCDVPHATPRHFRRTYATAALNADKGPSPRNVALRMGNSMHALNRYYAGEGAEIAGEHIEEWLGVKKEFEAAFDRLEW